MILQVVNALLCNEEEKRCEEINVLLNNCSQQTFISEKVVKKLGLKSIGEVDRNISAFGSERGKGMRLKEYDVVLKPIYKGNSIYNLCSNMQKICKISCRTKRVPKSVETGRCWEQ